MNSIATQDPKMGKNHFTSIVNCAFEHYNESELYILIDQTDPIASCHSIVDKLYLLCYHCTYDDWHVA